MGRMRESIPVIALGVALSACSNSPEAGAPVDLGLTDTSANQIDNLCQQPAYGQADYLPKTGSELIADIGTPQAEGPVFTKSVKDTATDAIRVVAPNNASLAIIETIESAAAGITPVDVNKTAIIKFNQLQSNREERQRVCVRVLSRFTDTPELRDYSSPSGIVAVYNSEYTGANLTSLSSVSTPNVGTYRLLGVNAVKGSPNEVVDDQVSYTWGLTPTGQVIQTAYTIGNSRFDITGQPFMLGTTGPQAAPSPSPVAGVESAQAGGSNGGGVAPGQQPEKNPNGPNSGPSSGNVPEAAPGTDNTPNNGGKKPGAPAGTPRPNPTTPPTRPPETTPPTRPPETQPPTTPPPTTEPKDTPPPVCTGC